MSYLYPKRSGNQVATFIDQQEFFKHFEKRCENAEINILCGVSFVDWHFPLPNGKKWWVFLMDLKKNKPQLIIRVLFWRNTSKYWSSSQLITGDGTDLNFIKKNEINKHLQFKWDESPNIPHCHHGKYYIIDNKYSLIGGMTLNGHQWFDYIHDTFMEINGPSSIDVRNNFKLRWNNNNIFTSCEAIQLFKTTQMEDLDIKVIKECKDDENKYDHESESDNLVDCKIVWSCAPKLYPQCDDGSETVYNEYMTQFKNAKSWIYIESQHMGEYKLLKLMKEKLESDDNFYILYLVPIWMKNAILKEKEKSINYSKNPQLFQEKPRYFDTFEILSSLNKYKNFCLSGVYHDFNKVCNKTNKKKKQSFWNKTLNSFCNQFPQYIHSKLCISDGKWFTIGSANMVDISFLKDHTEINACIYDKNEASILLRKLAIIHCNKQDNNEIFDKLNDKEIIKYMINSSRTKTNGLYELDSELYGTAKHAGFLYKMLSSFI